MELAEKAADEVVRALTQWKPQPGEETETAERTLTFSGSDYEIARESMEKYFSSTVGVTGLPLAPLTLGSEPNARGRGLPF